MPHTIKVTKATAIIDGRGVTLVNCTASQQFTRLCDLVGSELGVPALDQKVRVFVEKVQTAYNQQLNHRERARVWEAGRIVVRKDYAATKFSPFTWLLPRSRALNAEVSSDAPAQVSKPARKQATMAKEKSTEKKIVKHDITLPKEGTTCRKIFDMADRFNGERAKVLAECEKKGINAATATTQFGKWRQFNGLKGRTVKKKATKKSPPPPPRKKATPPAPPAAS